MSDIGPRTKGLRLRRTESLADLRARLAGGTVRVDDELFSWPLLTLDEAALAHNIATLAAVAREYGVWHAPHVKTPMSADIWARQEAAGAWAATVAMPHQVRVVRDWGVRRVLLANELVDPREVRWLADELAADPTFEIWLEVDSAVGVAVLADGLASPALRERVHPLIEVGVPGGRTGTRTVSDAVVLASALVRQGFSVDGVIGFEGPVAADASPAALEAVRQWVGDVLAVADAVADGSASRERPFVLSVGGSAHLDVTLPALAGVRQRGWQGVIRSGAYVTHDHGHYADLDPWSRLPGDRALQAAITPRGVCPGYGLLARQRPVGHGLPGPVQRRHPAVLPRPVRADPRPAQHGPAARRCPLVRRSRAARQGAPPRVAHRHP